MMAQGILKADIRRPIDQVGQMFAADRFLAKGLTETVVGRSRYAADN